MGCGPGRLLAPLTESGWSVVGYEPDPDYAGAAEAKATELPGGRIRRAGLLDLDEIGAFDLIAAVNGPYSYLLEPEQRREALDRCARALRPGGVLFLEFGNFYWILKNYRAPAAEEFNAEGILVTRTAHHDIDFHRGTFVHHDRFTWVDESGVQQVVSKTHRMAIVSFPEVAYFLRELGYTDIRTFSSYEDRNASELTGRRVLIAARAPSGLHALP
jgi:SAM-dependent methyltransferase